MTIYTDENPLFLADELANRMQRLRAQLTIHDPEWKQAAIMGRTNVFYLTGTIQSGVVWIPRDDEAEFMVRRSFERARHESPFPKITPMRSFRALAEQKRHVGTRIYVETRQLSLDYFELFNKYFGFTDIRSINPVFDLVRAVKSTTELTYLRQAGAIHKHVFEDLLPDMLQEGMSEAELTADLMQTMIRQGHQGVSRVQAFNSELFLGQICFGTSSMWGNIFDSPGGVRGFSAAVPLAGSTSRTLQAGDIVSVDTGCNFNGYHTDKTITACFNGRMSQYASDAHQQCIDIQNKAASMLRPGAIPETIYRDSLAHCPESFLRIFMGTGSDQVRFLGHGVGLAIDEWPALAKGFTVPLQENMVIALEPKAWIPHEGMVGTENTFIVTANGGELIT